MATPEPARPIILPSRGIARVKNVLSGDTVILLGKASAPGEKAPEVVFTLENISAPRYVMCTLLRLSSGQSLGRVMDCHEISPRGPIHIQYLK